MSITNEPGAYFRYIYADLLKRLPSFPATDPAPNLKDCISAPNQERSNSGPNFVRAEMLARQHNLPSDVITHLREIAILQYVIDYKNFVGLEVLIREFGLSPDEVSRIIELIKTEKTYPCFSYTGATELAVGENWAEVWHRDYLPHIQHLTK